MIVAELTFDCDNLAAVQVIFIRYYDNRFPKEILFASARCGTTGRFSLIPQDRAEKKQASENRFSEFVAFPIGHGVDDEERIGFD